MANVNFNDVDNYTSSSKTGFFSISNDKESARVRFLFNSGADLEILTCHEMSIGGVRRKVNCLKSSWNSPVEECPLCANGNRPSVKYYIPLIKYDLGDDGSIVDQQVLIWERGASFKEDIQALLSRFDNLQNYVFDVVRQGAKSDMKTRYMIWPLSEQECAKYPLPTPEQISSIAKAKGTIVADKTEAEIKYAMQYGAFPDSNGENNNANAMGKRPAYSPVPSNNSYAPPVQPTPYAAPQMPPTGGYQQPVYGAPYGAPGEAAIPTQPYSGSIPQGGRRS